MQITPMGPGMVDGLPALPIRKAAVACGYAAQGLGYAAVMTALPSFQDTWGIDDMGISVILLGTCVMAGIGSVAADLVAVRRGSRVAVCTALAVQAVAVATMAFAPAFGVFIAAVVVYGIGLGTMDAAANMQGTMLEARTATPHLGRFYAAYTAAAALGAVAMSAFLSTAGGAVGALLTAAVVQVGVAVFGIVGLDPSRELAHEQTASRPTDAADDSPRARTPLPRRAIWLVGSTLMAIYMLDSAVSTWSTVYLTNAFDNLANLAPLGYAMYQVTTLLSRLVTDRLEMRVGVVRLALSAVGIGVVGCVVIAAVPAFPGAIVGLAIAGVGGGILIPVTFAAAGRILPARRDEVIARVNLFNYAGVILGAVIIGAIASGSGIGVAFLIPAAGLIAVIPLARRIDTTRRQPAQSPS
ncbi:MFS transporter [Gordonia sp. DT30]|uniref:MFS transporter n=1 Tax=unclassified Gordonia (in: high G+C Gram-positive bacteria) TaxID=2657482 RepID=UPI003CFA720E